MLSILLVNQLDKPISLLMVIVHTLGPEATRSSLYTQRDPSTESHYIKGLTMASSFSCDGTSSFYGFWFMVVHDILWCPIRLDSGHEVLYFDSACAGSLWHGTTQVGLAKSTLRQSSGKIWPSFSTWMIHPTWYMVSSHSYYKPVNRQYIPGCDTYALLSP